jgi:mycofactocin precursor
MADSAAAVIDQAQVPAAGEPCDAGEPGDQDQLVAAELLVEEISIDGMCGVY